MWSNRPLSWSRVVERYCFRNKQSFLWSMAVFESQNLFILKNPFFWSFVHLGGQEWSIDLIPKTCRGIYILISLKKKSGKTNVWKGVKIMLQLFRWKLVKIEKKSTFLSTFSKFFFLQMWLVFRALSICKISFLIWGGRKKSCSLILRTTITHVAQLTVHYCAICS